MLVGHNLWLIAEEKVTEWCNKSQGAADVSTVHCNTSYVRAYALKVVAWCVLLY